MSFQIRYPNETSHVLQKITSLHYAGNDIH